MGSDAARPSGGGRWARAQGQQGRRRLPQPADRPQRRPPVCPHAGKPIRLRQPLQRCHRHRRPSPDLCHRPITGSRAPRSPPPRESAARPFAMRRPMPDRHEPPFGVLQRAIPLARVDANRAHLHAMLPRIPHHLRRGVEPHRLRVQQGGAEHVRVVAFHPGAGIGDQREGGCVAFGEAVGAEALDLLERAFGEFGACSRARPCR